MGHFVPMTVNVASLQNFFYPRWFFNVFYK